MGQSSSKAALRLPRSTPRGTSVLRKAAAETARKAKEASSSAAAMKTREQMLAEDPAEDEGQDAKLSDNLKYFLNPKELLTPITPKNPNENINVQTLKSRREDDDFEVVGGSRLKGSEVVKLLRELGGNEGDERAVESVAKKYGLEPRTVRDLARFLDPLPQPANGRP